MRLLASMSMVVGVLLGVISFVITAHAPTLSPWPSFVGCRLTTLGVVLLATKRDLTPQS
jgi:hypothetical protein